MAEQSYSNPAGRNTQVAAGAAAGGKGTIPGKVSVPFPQNANSPAPSGAAKPKAPKGFDNGLINGKV